MVMPNLEGMLLLKNMMSPPKWVELLGATFHHQSYIGNPTQKGLLGTTSSVNSRGTFQGMKAVSE